MFLSHANEPRHSLDKGKRVEVHNDDVHIQADISEDAARYHQQVANHSNAVA